MDEQQAVMIPKELYGVIETSAAEDGVNVREWVMDAITKKFERRVAEDEKTH